MPSKKKLENRLLEKSFYENNQKELNKKIKKELSSSKKINRLEKKMEFQSNTEKAKLGRVKEIKKSF